MAFDGTEGGAISLSSASAMTAEYRLRNPNSTLAHFFGKDIIEHVLEQNGCMGIRMYYGLDPDTGNKELILVGADADENDMLDVVADLSRPCPNVCGATNALNS